MLAGRVLNPGPLVLESNSVDSVQTKIRANGKKLSTKNPGYESSRSLLYIEGK